MSTLQKPVDLLFAEIEKIEEKEGWGTVLDAGTGDHSLKWICSMREKIRRWVAVTGDPSLRRSLQKSCSDNMRQCDEIISGNWQGDDPKLLDGQVFDVVLADYLIGAMEAFSPFYQDQLFHRIRPLVGRRIYVIGLEPLPPSAPSSNPGGQLLVEITRCRDACILLAGHQVYREFPQSWIERKLTEAGFEVDHKISFANVYDMSNIRRQLNVCRSKIKYFKLPTLAEQMQAYINDIERRAELILNGCEGHKIRFGADYVVAAKLTSK